MAWVNLADQSGDNMVFGTYNAAPYLHLGFRNADAYFGHWGGANDDSSVASGISAGTWHHWAWRYDGSQAIFRDGVLLNTDAAQNAFAALDDLWVGRTNGNGGALNGSIDEVRLFNEALTDGQIAAFAAIPEPTSFALATLALVGLAAFRHRRGR